MTKTLMVFRKLDPESDLVAPYCQVKHAIEAALYDLTNAASHYATAFRDHDEEAMDTSNVEARDALKTLESLREEFAKLRMDILQEMEEWISDFEIRELVVQ